MAVRYARNPAVRYLRVSDDEVVAKGGHLDGFSLVIRDESGRGLAALITDVITEGASAEEVHRSVPTGIDVSLEEIERFLTELHDCGVAVRIAQERASMADWLGFVRFGEIPRAVAAHPLVLAGSDAAKVLADRLTGLGLPAGNADLDDLDPRDFAEPDGARLVALTDGGPIQALYDLNERAVAARTPVLYLQTAGVEWAVGPYVMPGATACFWEFERQRTRAMSGYSEYAILAAEESRGERRPVSDVVRQAAVSAATPFLVELALLGESSLANHVLRGRATTGETRRHAVMRLPRCPTCLPLRPPIRSPLV